MSKLDKILGVFGFEFVNEDEGVVRGRDEETAASQSANASAPANPGVNAQVVLIEPERIGDAKEICDELKQGKTVVVNVERLEKADVIRLYDFITGASYALSGKLKEINENVLVVAPVNVDIKMTAVTVDRQYDDYDEEYEY